MIGMGDILKPFQFLHRNHVAIYVTDGKYMGWTQIELLLKYNIWGIIYGVNIYWIVAEVYNVWAEHKLLLKCNILGIIYGLNTNRTVAEV